MVLNNKYIISLRLKDVKIGNDNFWGALINPYFTPITPTFQGLHKLIAKKQIVGRLFNSILTTASR